MTTRVSPTPNIRADDMSAVKILAPTNPEYDRILTPAALSFLTRLSREFDARRHELLQRRQQRQTELDAGVMPDFLQETRDIRESDWIVAPIPHDLQNRRVEITGPVDRKMIINALNSGANVFMADFEDSNSPTWDNCIQGQINLRDAVAGTIDFVSPEGKTYRLNEKIATLLVRPRGWHLDEKHVLIDGKPISGSLFDFGLYFFHNAKALIAKGTGPYFYLPKLESHHEARLWNDVFLFAQKELDIPRGTIRATVLIETILAAFEMNEILYELREHSAGLNCGRWDYIFSVIKKFRNHSNFTLSDRALVTMTTPFMRAYTQLTIKTCHRRGIHAMGGMAAQIPIKNDPAANEAALAKVTDDKAREVQDGHDGTWVAHPGLVPIAAEQFARMPGDNQIYRKRCDVQVSAADLLGVPENPRVTEQGIRTNINVGIQYLESWLRGSGCVPINNLMEDAATAEISRSQVWQWVVSPNGILDDGRKVTVEMVRPMIAEELAKVKATVAAQGEDTATYDQAAEIFDRMSLTPDYPEFLTLPLYEAMA